MSNGKFNNIKIWMKKLKFKLKKKNFKLTPCQKLKPFSKKLTYLKPFLWLKKMKSHLKFSGNSLRMKSTLHLKSKSLHLKINFIKKFPLSKNNMLKKYNKLKNSESMMDSRNLPIKSLSLFEKKIIFFFYYKYIRKNFFNFLLVKFIIFLVKI
jgi:hypothetical protein